MSLPREPPAAESAPEYGQLPAEVARLTAELVRLGALRVVLFGSHARGDAGPDSDVDLLVVMPCPAEESYASRLARVARAIDPRVPVDLLVYTPAELDRLAPERRFVRQALAEGRVLHAA